MILIFVTIYIYRKFAELAVAKSLNKSKWGLIGSGIYLGFGLGLQFVLGILIGINLIPIDLDSFGGNILIAIVCYAIGGLVGYLVYLKLKAMPDDNLNIDNFGKKEEDRD